MTAEERIFRGSPHYYERVEGVRFGQADLDFLSLNLPPTCNYRCKFCFAGMGQNRLPEFADTLSIEEIQSLIDTARELGVRHLEISGEGEPFMYPGKILAILRHATEQGIHTTLFTNGALLNEALLTELASHDVSIAFSVDMPDKEGYEQFVGRKNSYERIIENLAIARDMFRQRIQRVDGRTVFPLAIHTIINDQNRGQIQEIRALTQDEIFFSLAPMIHRGDAQINPGLGEAQQEDADIISRDSDGSVIVSDTSVATMGRPLCATFQYGVGLRHNGEGLFDAHCFESAGQIGNIRDLPLQKIVARVRALQQRYFETHDDGGFCPLRNPNFDRFLNTLQI